MAKPKQKPRYITPAGIANYCYVDKPDTKFKDAGEYKTNLTLSAEDAAPFIKMADEAMETMKASEEVAELETKRKEWNKKNKAQPKKQIDELQENLPYAAALDDNGDETGDFVFKFSTAASGTNKKTGKDWTRKLDVFDAKKKPIKTAVWSGSTIKVAFTVGEYVATPQIGYGVKFYLEAVQVLDLKSGGSRDADGYGFGEEEGYEASDEVDETATDAADAVDADDDTDAAAF